MDKIGTSENILFWSRVQNNFLKDERMTRVMFNSFYGTGNKLSIQTMGNVAASAKSYRKSKSETILKLTSMGESHSKKDLRARSAR